VKEQDEGKGVGVRMLGCLESVSLESGALLTDRGLGDRESAGAMCIGPRAWERAWGGGCISNARDQGRDQEEDTRIQSLAVQDAAWAVPFLCV
jgi:hypothetical protein